MGLEGQEPGIALVSSIGAGPATSVEPLERRSMAAQLYFDSGGSKMCSQHIRSLGHRPLCLGQGLLVAPGLEQHSSLLKVAQGGGVSLAHRRRRNDVSPKTSSAIETHANQSPTY